MIPASLTIKAKDTAKKNPKLLLVVLIVAHLIVISLNRVPGQPDIRIAQVVALTVAWPFQWAISHSVGAVKGGVNHYIYLRDKTSENESLKARNAELEAQAIELGEKARLLDQLNAINQSQALSAYPKIVARVIGRDSQPWFGTIVIDRGSASGVERNQPVVTAGGLVGRVILTTTGTARVLLITDERHGAGAVIAQATGARTLGILKGKTESLCSLNFSEPPARLENGEPVITSGQDQLYPKGLLIGHVKNLSGSGPVPPSVDVEPAAPMTQLETVAVITLPPQEIRRQYDELVKAEQQEKEKQEKTTGRARRDAGR